MKTSNTFYHEGFNLKEYLERHGIDANHPVLIQIFTGNDDTEFIARLRDKFCSLLPHGIMIGATTDGEIANGIISTKRTVLSFTQFEKTTLTSAAVYHTSENDSFATGREIAKLLISEKTKVLILFGDGRHTNGQELLKGMESVNSNVVVAGGLAADHAMRTQNFVFTQHEIVHNGVVGVALDSDQLIVNTNYHFDWTNIGKTMTITKADNNRVYEIDHLPAIEIYRKYLGKEIGNQLSRVGGLFPLVINKKEHRVARGCLGSHTDGSLTFAGNINEGDQVQFGYGNAEMVLDSSNRTVQNLKTLPAESIFVYSCSARRRSMPELMDAEIIPLQRVAPTAGFFSYGEFYHFPYTNELLNQTMTVLILSENTDVKRMDEILPDHKDEQTGPLDYIKAVAHLVNVTTEELKRTNEALRENEERYRRLVESSPETIAVYYKKKIVLVNQAGANMIGAEKPEDLIGRSIYEFVHQDDRETIEERIRKSQESGVLRDLIVEKLVRLDGQVIDVEMVIIPFTYSGKPAAQIFVRDITERKKYEEQIKFHAYYDTLTGLPNRLQFNRLLSTALFRATRNGNMLAVLFLDLDRFKIINDTLGHSLGDQLLCAVAERLKECLREEDTVARLAGDEFTVLLPDITSVQDAVTVAQNIIDAVTKPFIVQGYELFITTSIGISVYPSDGDTIETLVKHADTAMYRVKEQGKNNYQIFTPEMRITAFQRLILENALRKAVERNEFTLFYQPLVDAYNNRVVGMEALIRWYHPEFGIVSPYEFIPLAEETGLIVPIGEWVLRTACEQNKAWQEAGYPSVRMSVNLSSVQFLQQNLVETITRVLEETGLDAKWLELEMTESIMQNSEDTIATLHQLRAMGIKISIDDFGTGYSSLSYLKHLPIDALKIDQTFVQDITTDPAHEAIVKAIVEMAHSLKLKVTAEGVETDEQALTLREFQCDQMQGYLFSKPLKAEEVWRLLAEGRGLPFN